MLNDISRMWKFCETAGFSARIKALHRPLLWRSAAGLASDWGLILAAFACVLAWGWLAVPPALLIIGNRQRALGNLMHDAAHGSFGANRSQADVIAQFCLFRPMCNDLALYRAEHFAHHRRLGVPGHDPDLIHCEDDLTKSWAGLWWRHVADMAAWKGSVLAHIPRAPAAERCWFAIWWGGLLALLALLISPRAALEFLALWLAARATTFHAITIFREISDHAGLRPGTLLGFSRNTTARGVLNALFHPHHNGLHLVHHLNPGMPFHALPAAHRLLLAWPEYAAAAHCGSYAALVKSWVREEASGRFFEKKLRKKLLRIWATGVETGTV